MPKDAIDAPMRSFSFRWHCICGASWSANLVKTPRNPDIKPVLDKLRVEWDKIHSEPGHGQIDSGRAAAWARRKAEEETLSR